jgi:transcriptional regulator with XRE-family HTH domain
MRTRLFSPDEERVGDRIRHFRKQRGMSQRQLGVLIGKDHRTIGRMETGDVSCDNRHTLAAIADVLGVPLDRLTGVPTIGGKSGAHLVAACTAATTAFINADLDFPGDPSQVRPIEALRRDVDELVRRRVACEYADLARLVTALVPELHATATTGPDDQRRTALGLFVMAAETASMSVRYSGNSGSAAMIAERGWYAAQLAGDPISLAVASWARAHAALGCGLNERAWRLAEAGADRLRPTAEQAMPMLGMLSLTSAFAQAGMGRYGAALGPLGEATELATLTGETKDFGLYFGPTNVAFWRVAIDVDGGEPESAIQIANTVNSTTIPSASRQATFNADVGRAFARIGNAQAAVRRFRTARRIAPVRIDADPFVQEAVRGLVDTAHRQAVSGDLRSLAEQMHVPV